MTAPALLIDVSEIRTEPTPRPRLSIVVAPVPEATTRAKLAALITAQLWSAILGRRGDLLGRTIAGAIHGAVSELGREFDA